jgi:hypothetical protein
LGPGSRSSRSEFGCCALVVRRWSARSAIIRCSGRTGVFASKTSIPSSTAAAIQSSAHVPWGSHCGPAVPGVPIGCRSPPKWGPYSPSIARVTCLRLSSRRISAHRGGDGLAWCRPQRRAPPPVRCRSFQPAPALRLRSTTGPTLDLLILQIRDWCRTHQVEPIKFTYQLAGRSPQLCIECHLDADIKKLALAFPGGTRLLNCHNLAFTV